MLINQIHFQSKTISPLNLIMFLFLWFVFILFNSLSLLFDCCPCVQLNSEGPLQDTKGYNDMKMLQSSQYFFPISFLFYLKIFFGHGWAGSDGRSRSRDEEEEEQLKRRQLQEEHLSKVKPVWKLIHCLCHIFWSKQPFKCIYMPNWAAMQLFTHPFCILLLPKSLKWLCKHT